MHLCQCILLLHSPLHLQSVRTHYSEEGIMVGPSVKMTFAEDEIKLNIPDVGIALPSGWSLQPLECPKVSGNFLFFFHFVFSVFPPPSLYLFQ